ncbi:MAG TPA: methyltransferase domain-containing protein [Nitrososphaerales archaeon]|nr:methyltransferase domain-containing protein [Nitrososphaerales archaeon]
MSFFNEAYRGVPPWDIGRPQAEFVKLAEEGKVVGDVIDIGCGTGENAMMFASKGHKVLGVDSSPLAIQKANATAKKRNSSAEFMVADALDLPSIGKKFDAAIDCGLFHVFSDSERGPFAKSLREVLNPERSYFMLCFSDREPSDWGGPRRVTKEEIRTTFSSGWRVDWIRSARFESKYHHDGGYAWLSSMTRLK